MQGAKPWQIILFVAGLLAAVAAFWYSCSSSNDLGLTKEFKMVDVATGDLFLVKLPKSGSIAMPTKHPDTGEVSLAPAYQEVDGTWRLVERYASPLAPNKAKWPGSPVDFKAYTVKVSDKAMRTIVGE